MDGDNVQFFPDDLIRLYGHAPNAVRRVCLHMLLHCLFLHLDASGHTDDRLWDLACDIAVEQLIEAQKMSRLAVADARKQDFLRRLDGNVQSAEQIYEF